MDKVIRTIRALLFSAGIALIAETLILQFTDNRMYVCPKDAFSILKENEAGFELDDIVSAEENRFGGGADAEFQSKAARNKDHLSEV